RPIAKQGDLSGHGGIAKLDLRVDPLRLLARCELLLDRRPVVRVVDVPGGVHLRGPEGPGRAVGPFRWIRMAKPHVCVAPAGALLIDRHELGRKAHRPPTLWVEADPERHRLDRRTLAPDRGPALGGEPADPAAEGARRDL